MISLTDEDARFASEKLSGGCAAMEQLLKGLLDSNGRVAEQVHAIRKLGKSLRGGFSLFRLGENSAREIQAIGRLLSGPRDAVSRLSTWGKLGWDDDAATMAAIVGLLDQQTQSAALRPPSETITWCVERVTTARRSLLELPQEDLAGRISTGLRKLEKQVTKRCKHLDHHGEEDFHDARKALKAYLGALGFLPQGIVTLDPRMLELPEILGDENDLATLSDWLAAHGFTKKLTPALWKKLKDSREKLRKQAIQEAELLVASSNKD